MSSPELQRDPLAAEPSAPAADANSVIAVEAAPESAAPAVQPAIEPAPPKPQRGGCLMLALGLVVLLVLLGGVAGGGWWWLTQGPADTGTAAAASAPVAPEPASPPPVVQFALAPPPAGSEQQSAAAIAASVERLGKAVAGLEAELAALPATGVVSSALIVPASGRQTADSVSQVPRHERWEFQFPPGNTIESYTRQLDYFQIEVGIIGGDSDKIQYLEKIAEPVPTVRTGSASAEQRLYLLWQRGSMREADEQLASRARVSLAGKIVAHFCPPELEANLAQLEDAHASQQGIAKVRKTVFGIKANDFGGFQFFVSEQKADEP